MSGISGILPNKYSSKESYSVDSKVKKIIKGHELYACILNCLEAQFYGMV